MDYDQTMMPTAILPKKCSWKRGRKKRPASASSGDWGEALPLTDASVDMVFISMVFHHFETPHKAVEECHRVLRAEGVVCLRAAVTDRINAYPYVPFFPRTSSLLAAHLRGLAYIEDVFSAGGFN